MEKQFSTRAAMGSGVGSVDLEAAREKGISVANVPATAVMPNPSQSMEYC